MGLASLISGRRRKDRRSAFSSAGGERIGWWPLVGLCLLGLSFYLLGIATENTALFGSLYSLLLLLNVGGLVLLSALIVGNLFQLVRQYRRKVMGSHLRLRLVMMFVFLSVTPVLGVYYYSLQFLHQGIDSWFDVRVDTALKDALELSRSSFELRMRELLRGQRDEAASLVDVGNELAPLSLGEIRGRLGARELTLLGPNGSIIGTASADPRLVVPDQPDDTVIQQVKSGQAYVGLDPVRDDQLNARIVVPLEDGAAKGRMLQGLYSMPKHVNDNAKRVEQAISGHRELAYLREPLKFTFTLTLSLVLFLSLAFAVWAAFFASRRLSAPIHSLAEGTRAVAEGDYSKRLPLPPDDELGALVQSFNTMTLNIALARDAAARSKRQVEAQHAYLETLLTHLSSGVLSLDSGRVVRKVNSAAGHILGVELERYQGWPLSSLYNLGEALHPFVRALVDAIDAGEREWRKEMGLQTAAGHKMLLLRGARLIGEGPDEGGDVIVFDDVTAIVRAQRDAAWAEVARRLAHEIKNPLTPIQLSAERLRHKFLSKMEGRDAEVFERGTHTIVQQVEAMKAMVNDFNDFARPARGVRKPLNLGVLLDEVADLYKSAGGVAPLHLHCEPELSAVNADSGQLRQVLHNLLTNAREATEGRAGARIDLYARNRREHGRAGGVEVRVCDNGPGFEPDMMPRLFEPYVTGKPRGTGLGLAIVKKIIDDHGGILRAENRSEGGACVSLCLPPADGRAASSATSIQVQAPPPSSDSTA